MHPLSTCFVSLAAVAALSALSACSSNYHPEYHPVAVSNFSQNIAYPPASTGNGASAPNTVYVLPAPQGVIAIPAPAAPVDAPPPDFFR